MLKHNSMRDENGVVSVRPMPTIDELEAFLREGISSSGGIRAGIQCERGRL